MAVNQPSFQINNQTKIEDNKESLKKFFETITSKLEAQKLEYETFYDEYLTLLQAEVINPPFATLQRADTAFTKITSALSKFLVALKEDLSAAIDLSNKMIYVRNQRKELIKQGQNKPKNAQQLIEKIKNLEKEFKELAADHETIIYNMFELQKSINDQTVIYTSHNGKEFRIMIKQGFEDFLKNLGVNDETGMLGVVKAQYDDEIKEQLALLNDDNLERVISLDPIDGEQTGTSNTSSGRKPRDSITIDGTSIIVAIDVTELKNKQVIERQENDRVMSVLLQDVKAKLRNWFVFQIKGTDDDFYKFLNSKYKTEISNKLSGILITTFDENLLKKLDDAHYKLARHGPMNSITDILKIPGRASNDDEDMEYAIEDRETRDELIKIWLNWTKTILMYAYFLLENIYDNRNTNPAIQTKYKLIYQLIKIHLYNVCIKEVEANAHVSFDDNEKLRQLKMNEYINIVIHKIRNNPSS